MELIDINELLSLDHDELVKTLVHLSRKIDEDRADNKTIDVRSYFKQDVYMEMIIASRDLIIFTLECDNIITDILKIEVDAKTYLYYYDH